mmetsp:Transcript_4559/g.6904  ORF Transcript_4559/g.6904 Transcript_4559/m.6904 type:complete len:426 (-) Transcript_4559:7-1284(-)|eukprot:CAMPEP_0171462650 /NCGR_PEP_ID=MMETSP0945-20130129/6599_1 /TAXON_ID=109269 /ORGANISM="Vaucheria litorea, Strain CCMP2940" /LENGTH=425 /DNA_ID=CAMNT_0011989211 /DNA_START=126 /DNA_END=1403 /DNA_ORIENTATION=-
MQSSQIHKVVSPLIQSDETEAILFNDDQSLMKLHVENLRRKREKNESANLSKIASELFPKQAKQFKMLQEISQEIDLIVQRKSLQLLEDLTKHYRMTSTKKILRIWASSFIATIPDNNDIWIVRVEGALLGPKQKFSDKKIKPIAPRLKFTSFFDLISLEMVGMSGTNIFEWSSDRNTGNQEDQTHNKRSEVDGIELKGRLAPLISQGQKEIHYRLVMMRRAGGEESQLQNRVTLSPELRKILPGAPDQVLRGEVIEAIRCYVLSKHLLDKDDHSIINCDSTLKDLFKCATIPFASLRINLEKHFLSLMPYVFEGKIDLDPNFKPEPVHFDIEVDLKSSNREAKLECFQKLKNLNCSFLSGNMKVRNDELQRKAEYLAGTINSKARSIKVMNEIGKSPKETAGKIASNYEMAQRVLRASAFEKPA